MVLLYGFLALLSIAVNHSGPLCISRRAATGIQIAAVAAERILAHILRPILMHGCSIRP
jgi:hypothetical protein